MLFRDACTRREVRMHEINIIASEGQAKLEVLAMLAMFLS